MTKRLEGKVALVTGASQGIGEGIGRLMLAEGAIVYFSGEDSSKVSRAAEGAGAYAVTLDVTSERDWHAAATRIEREHGQLDVLVNNAGVESYKPISETSLAEWRRVFAVNLDGVFLGCKTMQPLLQKGGASRETGASVINISSIVANIAYSGQAAYGASKAGVRHLTKLLAVEWAEQAFNIRSNSIHPGTIRTEMFEKAIIDAGFSEDGDDGLEKAAIAISNLNPIRRLGKPQDIAFGAVYLASDEAGFVTGTELLIDGGYVAR
jgi:3(or 17)beta-hydroxysteroid dehydrogenase